MKTYALDSYTLLCLFDKKRKEEKEASLIKAKFPVSYADAFCVALSKETNHPAITSDPKFDSVKDFIKVVPLVE